MMGLLPSITPLGAKFRLLDSRTGSGSTVTYTNVVFGPPSANALLVIPVGATNGSNDCFISAFTVAGNNATIDVQGNNTLNSRNGHAVVASIMHPGVATGSVVITWTAGTHACVMGLIRIDSPASFTVFDTDPTGGIKTDGTDPNMNINIPPKGLAVAAYGRIGSGASWTGVDEILNQAGEGGDVSSVAWRANLDEATGYAITAGGANTPNRYVCASYG